MLMYFDNAYKYHIDELLGESNRCLELVFFQLFGFFVGVGILLVGFGLLIVGASLFVDLAGFDGGVLLFLVADLAVKYVRDAL